MFEKNVALIWHANSCVFTHGFTINVIIPLCPNDSECVITIIIENVLVIIL